MYYCPTLSLWLQKCFSYAKNEITNTIQKKAIKKKAIHVSKQYNITYMMIHRKKTVSNKSIEKRHCLFSTYIQLATFFFYYWNISFTREMMNVSSPKPSHKMWLTRKICYNIHSVNVLLKLWFYNNNKKKTSEEIINFYHKLTVW